MVAGMFKFPAFKLLGVAGEERADVDVEQLFS